MNCEIITIISNNYGNRLQNYALQKCLEKNQINSTTNRVVNHKIKVNTIEFIKRHRKKKSSDFFSIFNRLINWRIVDSIEKVDSDEIDYFVAGSDQIWNPMFKFNSDREFLCFTDKSKRIAYAASIGLSELPEKEKERYKNNIMQFKAVSVRENEAADIIEELTGKRPEVVLDPTLLLNSEEWDIVAKKSNIKIDSPYIVKYFLGIRDKKIMDQIDEFAHKNNYQIIDITNEKKYLIGPSEFVYLLSNSEFNFVDSFHGTVFSMIFHKEFLSFFRPKDGCGDMNSRFSTLFQKLGGFERYVEQFPNIDNLDSLDYDEVERKLLDERKKSIDFLINAFGE